MAGSLSQDFNLLTPISDPPRKIQVLRKLLDKQTEADSLYPAGHQQVNLLGGRGGVRK